MTPHFQRAQVLLRQHRNDLAEVELRKHLAEVPGDPIARGILAICLSDQQKTDPAIEEARAAIGAGPDLSFGHYAMSRVLFNADNVKDAERAIDAAIGLDPGDADYHALKANLRFVRTDWPGALAAAEEALRLDPEHETAANLRGMALVKLGRKREAEAALDGLLARDPENALSQANQGWTQLERNDPKRALEHFRESLRIDPTLDWARAGMIEALKARNPVYRLILQFFLWMAKKSGKVQVAIILLFIFGRGALNSVADQNPALRPLVLPLIVLLALFFWLTWVASPLLNLTLLLHPYGRYALTRDDKRTAAIVGLLLLAALGSLIAWGLLYWTGRPAHAAVFGARAFLLLVLPVITMFHYPWGRKRLIAGLVALVAGLLAAVVLAAILVEAIRNTTFLRPDQARDLVNYFMILCVGSSWLPMVMPRRSWG